MKQAFSFKDGETLMVSNIWPCFEDDCYDYKEDAALVGPILAC